MLIRWWKNGTCQISHLYLIIGMYDTLEEWIRTYVLIAYSRTRRTSRKVFWWNYGLSSFKTATRKFFNTAKKSGERMSRRLSDNNAGRHAKRDSWRRYYEGVESPPAGVRLQRNLMDPTLRLAKRRLSCCSEYTFQDHIQ